MDQMVCEYPFFLKRTSNLWYMAPGAADPDQGPQTSLTWLPREVNNSPYEGEFMPLM